MDTGLTVRPVQPTSLAPVRIDPAPQRQVARTELPDSQAVTAPEEARPAPFDQDGQQLRADLNRVIDARTAPTISKVERDEVTRELIFRKLSASTGRVVQQFPDEAVLRQRAYAVQQRRAELDQATQGEERVTKVA